MRNILTGLALLLLGIGLLGLPACGGGGGDGGNGTLIANFDLEGEEFLALPRSPLERLCSLFTYRAARASDLGFNPNSFPYNQFTGEADVEGGLQVVVTAPDTTFIAQSETNATGQVSFTELPTGYLMLVITGRDGNNYFVPVHVAENTTSRTRVRVYRDPAESSVKLDGKTIHDEDGDGMNDDEFSYAVFGRPRNQGAGGRVHLHLGNETRIDHNGDGDFNDADDFDVIEPDDDGVSSDQGDGDEDNDGILDPDDDDMDGDGKLNDADDDIDGDGLLNADDPNPMGDSAEDDFDPPILDSGEDYSGVMDLAEQEPGKVEVFFPVGVDQNEPVRYIIYYSTSTPIDFETAPSQRFKPLGPVSPDEILSTHVIGLIAEQTYFFAVRAQDSAQPPNVDGNTNEMQITLGPSE